MEADAGATAPSLKDRLHVGAAEFRIMSRRDARLVLEDVRRGKWAECDYPFLVPSQVPSFPVKAIG